MSNINIDGVVANIKTTTNTYTPLIEVVVNSIQSIESAEIEHGSIVISIKRALQSDLDSSAQPDIVGFEVWDNGQGFCEENILSFNTLYSDKKKKIGGKGFGRFVCLKYYQDVSVRSVFDDGNGLLQERTFQMGHGTEIIENNAIKESNESECFSILKLETPLKNFQDKKIIVIARKLVENLLPYFLRDDCPRITLRDQDGEEELMLNNYLTSKDPKIIEIENARGTFKIGEKNFVARVFKIFSSKSKISSIKLVAHRRVVTSGAVSKFIPEFADEFCNEDGENFIVNVYIFGDYLDENVSLERGEFKFQKKPDLLHAASQNEIEEKASVFAAIPVSEDVQHRVEKKETQLRNYANLNPWHKSAFEGADLSKCPYNPSEQQMDIFLHNAKYLRDVSVKGEVRKLLAEQDPKKASQAASAIVKKVSEQSRDELTHYIALRKSVLEIFAQSIERNCKDGKYQTENYVHDIIFPIRHDTEDTKYKDHNLWIIDERLNFTEFLSSDKALKGVKEGRPDIVSYGEKVAFRGDNQPSNPVTIFEFKRPGLDNFTTGGTKEDPVQQIVRYVQRIREGKYKTPNGIEINVGDTTPFYGYVVCTLTKKAKDWFVENKNFTPMADGMGFFFWHGSLNLYVEAISWDKVLADAKMRNEIFFQKLNI